MDIDWHGMHRVYQVHGLLTDEDFGQLLALAAKVKMTALVGAEWSVVQLILSVHREIPLLVHYQAINAAFGFPNSGLQTFHERAIETGLLPPTSLNRTLFYRPLQKRLRLGELCVGLGIVDPVRVDGCLAAQAEILRQLKVKVSIGSLLLAGSHLSYPDFYQALALQAGQPYVGMDESAPQIFASLQKAG